MRKWIVLGTVLLFIAGGAVLFVFLPGDVKQAPIEQAREEPAPDLAEEPPTPSAPVAPVSPITEAPPPAPAPPEREQAQGPAQSDLLDEEDEDLDYPIPPELFDEEDEEKPAPFAPREHE